MALVAAFLFISICASTPTTRGAHLRMARGSVCGSNGVKYADHCAFELATCKPNDRDYDNIVTVSMKYCETETYSKKPEEKKASVCGVNGDTYQACEILKQRCAKDNTTAIVPLHLGACGNCSTENVCMLGKVARRKICAGEHEYVDKCEFYVARCLRYRRDQTVLEEKECPTVTAPKRFGKHIRIKKGSICGSDRRKYENFCTYIRATCKPDNRSHDTIFPVEMKYCDDDSLTVPEGTKAPLCGTNGITYQACQLGLQICNRKNPLVVPLHLGRCGVCTEQNICAWEAMDAIIAVQDTERPTICAGGEAYRTKCAFSVAQCKQYAKNQSTLKVEKCEISE